MSVQSVVNVDKVGRVMGGARVMVDSTYTEVQLGHGVRLNIRNTHERGEIRADVTIDHPKAGLQTVLDVRVGFGGRHESPYGSIYGSGMIETEEHFELVVLEFLRAAEARFSMLLEAIRSQLESMS